MKLKHLYFLSVGLMDFTTGLLLMFAPAFTCKLMMVGKPPADPIFLQWVGAFVFSVGSSYLIPLVRKSPGRFTGVLETTTVIRLVIGSFVVVSMLQGTLSARWISVAATDLPLAAIQLVMLRKRVFADVD